MTAIATTYKDVVDIQCPDLDNRMEAARWMLEVNDTLMVANHGKDTSIFGGDPGTAIRVAMVNMVFGVLNKDCMMMAIAMAALEVALNASEEGEGTATGDCEITASNLLGQMLRESLEKLPANEQAEVAAAIQKIVDLRIP